MQPFNLLLSTMQNTACLVSTTVCQLQLLQNSLPSNVQALPWSKSRRKPPRHNMDTINVDSFGLAHAIQRTSAALDPSIHRRMCHKRKLPLQCAAAAHEPVDLASPHPGRSRMTRLEPWWGCAHPATAGELLQANRMFARSQHSQL